MINILCVKIGTKYSDVYVNNLFKACRKNITIPFQMYCYTDDPKGIDTEINIIPFTDNGIDVIVHNKLFLFSDYVSNFLKFDNCVFFDLDLIIKHNIDNIVTIQSNDITVIHAQWRNSKHFKKAEGFPNFFHTYNSSCITWKKGVPEHIWSFYKNDIERFQIQYHVGMDAFLFYEMRERGYVDTFPLGLFHTFMFKFDVRLRITDQNKTKEQYNQLLEFNNSLTSKFPVLLLNGPTTNQDYEALSNHFYVD
jgi:hypothetical protein